MAFILHLGLSEDDYDGMRMNNGRLVFYRHMNHGKENQRKRMAGFLEELQRISELLIINSRERLERPCGIGGTNLLHMIREHNTGIRSTNGSKRYN